MDIAEDDDFLSQFFNFDDLDMGLSVQKTAHSDPQPDTDIINVHHHPYTLREVNVCPNLVQEEVEMSSIDFHDSEGLQPTLHSISEPYNGQSPLTISNQPQGLSSGA